MPSVGSFKVLFYIAVTCLVAISAVKEHKEVDECLSPTGKLGLCISLKKCPSLFSILREYPVRPARIKFLQSSTCAFENDEPWVCCTAEKEEEPAQPAEIPTPTTVPVPAVTFTSQPTIEAQPGESSMDPLSLEIQKHRNRRLLPNAQSCGVSVAQAVDRIIGGNIAGLGTYPWMTLLAFSDPSTGGHQLACGGTLISSRYVLTAAHCVSHLPDGFTVSFIRIGEYDQAHNPDCQDGICAPKYQDIPVEDVTAHEKYNVLGKYENDIALIRLQRRAILGTFVQPVCLPQGKILERTAEQEGSVIIAGWGRTRSKYQDGSSVLLQVTIPIVPMERCIDAFKLGSDDHTKICAGGEKGKDSCKGDSGGPLLKTVVDKETQTTHTYQLGIVSFGPPNCGNAIPAVYTKISHYMIWILDHLKD